MIEFDFLRMIDNYGKGFHNLGIAALIMDKKFRVISSNLLARRDYPPLSEPDGMKRVVAEFGHKKLLAALRDEGIVTLSDMVSFHDIRFLLGPVYRDGELVAVFTLLSHNRELAEPGAPQYKSKTADTLSSGIRVAVDSIFQSLDSLMEKGDILRINWVAPHADQISMQGYHALRIASNVTEYVRLQNGETSLAPVICNLSAWLEEITDAVEGLGREAGIPVHMMVPHRDCLVTLDLAHFEIAFFNILHNAFYYTKPGNEVFIAAQSASSGASITVQDKGLGIPGDIMGHIFDPYFSYAHGKPYGGSGLGLTLAERIIHAHGGELHITSESGEGTKADIVLPGNLYSGALPFAQKEPDYRISRDRFSTLYVGLSGIAASPHRRSQ